jgi:DNA repair protein RecN (Recombination protein N)
MLRELRVKNFAVLESVEVTFGPGLNVLTGETGAGKSILIDAILLIRGARAQSDIIRAGSESAMVEAVFDVDPRGPVAGMLDEAGLGVADNGEVVVRRELARSGRHRAFINDWAATVGLLERLGDHLVEVHGQHEHQRLLQPLYQLDLLDRFAEADALADRVADVFGKHRAALDALGRMRAADRDRAQREDLLRFQVSEIDAARLRPGEEADLRAELGRLRNAERFTGGLAEVGALLEDDTQSVTNRLARAVQILRSLGRVDSAFLAPIEALEAAGAQVEEATLAMRALRNALVFEPGRLEAIGERLDGITRLERKYGDGEEAILAFRREAAAELDRLARHDEILAEQERLVGELGGELGHEAEALSHRRRDAAQRLAAQAQRELRSLGMERATFTIAVEHESGDRVTPRGLDRVEMRLGANPGDPPGPLARVASGGELSRAMLALTTALAAAQPVTTMIFDEVDAGIGARLAGVVADKLATVARGRQVLCVTHLAPIAARAAHHVRIVKNVRGGRTRVAAEDVKGDERLSEIARMLGGEPTSATALEHARELLARSRAR